MKKFPILPLALLISLCVILLAACSGDANGEGEDESDPTADVSAAASPMASPSPTPVPTPAPFYNPLSGEAMENDISAVRPYAVIVNNNSAALPHCGISEAEIIYETLVEGGSTRMMAVFTDISDAGAIGTVRSIRPYFIDLSSVYDAIIVHAGGSDPAYSILRSGGYENIDGVNGKNAGNYFYRDAYRKSTAGLEHSMLIDSDDVLRYTEDFDYRTEHDGLHDYGLKFTSDGAPKDGGDCTWMKIVYSGAKSTTLSYDEDEGKYSMTQYNIDYIDGNTGDAVYFTNVLVLSAESRVVDSVGRRSFTLTGSGSGWFACGGKAVEITWSRASEDDVFTYRLSDGTMLELGVGASFISIIPSGDSSSSVSFE